MDGALNQFSRETLLRKRVQPIIPIDEFQEVKDELPPPYPTILSEYDFETIQDEEEQEANRALYGSKKPSLKNDKRRKKRQRREDQDSSNSLAVIPGSCSNLPIECKKRTANKKLPEGLYPIHCVCAFIGPRGAGKTTALINLVANYLKHKAFDRIKIISPTYDSNPEYEFLFQKLRIPEEERALHVCQDINIAPAFLQGVINEFKEDGLAYEDHMKYMEIYEKWKKGRPIDKNEIQELQRTNFAPPDPEVERPSAALIVDDMTHTPLLSRHSPYPHLLIKHRHVGGTNLGISIFTLVHNFKSGIPRCARQNVQTYHIWPMADESQLKDIWEETAAGYVTFDQFMYLFRQGISDPEAEKKGEQGHNFFTIDPYNKVILHRFRRNFDTYLTPPDDAPRYEKDEAVNNLPIEDVSSKK